jgi:threonine/homoserine/homoserine lactone efflux protein
VTVLIDWAGFVSAAVLISVIPGANQLLGLRNAVRYGMWRAMLAVFGRLGAFLVLVGLVVAGLGALLTAYGQALTFVKWCGVAYLVWLGLTSLWRARAARAGQPDDPITVTSGRLIRQEFLVAITNPKAMLLFAAVLPQFTSGGGIGGQLAVLGSAYLVIEASIALGYVAVGARIGGLNVLQPRLRRRIDLFTGSLFLVLAGFLAVSKMPEAAGIRASG